MTTTLQDYGRTSAKYGEIGFYYAFPYRFWFREHQLAPDDINTWCQENCVGYYRVIAYTHRSSVRRDDGSFVSKVLFVDKIYLSSPDDAVRIKLAYTVKDSKIMRSRIAPRRREVTENAY